MNNPEPSCTDIYDPGLISVKVALSQILSDVPVISGYERLNIETANGRTLYEPVIAAFNVPILPSMGMPCVLPTFLSRLNADLK
jgi:molybdopterin molybdotransferase